jgi:DNA repair exonuclease SbcCD ATPase subunit
MSNLIFTEISYKNFRSIGNTPITVKLNAHRTTAIAGPNGSGKSSLLSAICFALFGRGYGDITKPALVNAINQKQLLTTIKFEIGKKKFKIVRGIKPNIFEIYLNDKLVNQDPNVRDYQKYLEQQILKFNYRAFTQVVAVGGGTDYVPFMKLPAKDRREFVEDLLDIKVFSVMNTIVKDLAKDNKAILKDIASNMKSLKDKIILQESFIKKLKTEKTHSSEIISVDIKSLRDKNKEIQDLIDPLIINLANYDSDVEKKNTIDDALTEIRLLSKQTKLSASKLKEKKEFYSSLDICPTCSQSIHGEHKEYIVNSHSDELISLESDLNNLSFKENTLNAELNSFSDLLHAYSDIQSNISELQRDMFANTALINANNKKLTVIEEDSSSVDDEMSKLKDFAKDFMSTSKRRDTMLVEQQYQEFIQQLLADSGIKSKIIKQYIPTINKLINKYLADFDFFVLYNLDENFNETIKSRHRDTFTYNSFSEGQKRRIDIAILLTWNTIAKTKNSLNCNIAFMDEMDSNLDREGSELMHRLLKTASADNVFIISHKSEMKDKVDHVIEFTLKNNFTEIV